jgi:serine protease Do
MNTSKRKEKCKMFDTDEYSFEEKNILEGDGKVGSESETEQSTSKERVYDFSASNNTQSTDSSKETDQVKAETEYVEVTETREAPRTASEYIDAKPKSNGKFFKGVKFVGMAAAFGLVAGSVFYGVNYAADRAFGNKTTVPTDVVGESNGIVVNKTDNAASLGTYAVMDMSKIVNNATSSVVEIQGTVTQSYMVNPFFGGSYTTESQVSGTGVIIGQNDTELLLVTNAHVVDDTNTLTVIFPDKTEAEAVVKGSKSSKDIAVIAVKLSDISDDTLSKISIIEIGDSDNLMMGQPVVAVGNALGEGVSSTVGWISALDRTITISGKEYDNLIMTDAAINPGNSGGALLNTDGQLIGITSAKNADESVEGMGYAIPISSVADIIDSLMNRVVREKVDDDKIGYLGISGMDISSSISQNYGWPEGVLITKVGEGSPAEQTGLLKNDIIVSFDGEEVESFDQLKELMTYYEAGETVKLEYYRLVNGEYTLESVELVLGNRNAN